jgi:hypothetical protein
MTCKNRVGTVAGTKIMTLPRLVPTRGASIHVTKFAQLLRRG